MVKGVNKTVIEVNNTGSRIFEKIVFYVSPEYGSTNISKLQRAAGEFSFQFDEKGTYAPLRELHRKKRVKAFTLCIGVAVLITAAVICVFIL